MMEPTAIRSRSWNALKAILAVLCVLTFVVRPAHAQAPVITSISPTSGYAGQSTPIEIVGSNFGSSGTVTFNGTPVTSYSYWGANTIVPYIPAGATTGPIVVTTSAGSSGTTNIFTISSSASITSVSPTSVQPGGSLTITGVNLIGCSQIDVVVGGDANSSTSGNTITASVPNDSIAGPTTVLALCDGVATNQLPLTILPPPTLTSISPGNGYPGTPLTITGTGLQNCSTVSLNWVQVPSTATATSISFTSPAATEAGPVPVWAICGTYSTDELEYLVNMHYDNGTLALTVNGVTDSVPYGLTNTTSAAAAASLISAINADPNAYVTASANGSTGISLTSKDPGSVADFSYSFVDNYDTWDFSKPSFTSTPSSGTLAGATNAAVTTGVPVYSYSIPSPGTATTGYDRDGNVLSYTDSVMGTWSFGYDSINRLTSAVVSSGYYGGTGSAPYTGTNLAGATLAWTYDQFGNRLTQSSSSAALPTGSTQFSAANNQAAGTGLTSSPLVSTVTLAYDASGDLLGPTGTASPNIYDAEGRLCATPANSGGYEGYLYDAGGNRVAKGTLTSASCDFSINSQTGKPNNGFVLTSQYLLGPAGEQMTELNGAGQWVHTNVTANGSLLATFDNDNKGAHFTLTDWLGTKRVQTNYLGAVEESCQSLPFGDGLSCWGAATDATEHHFTGKERDTESGNDYFGARYYASSMGRMMSPDSGVDQHPEDPQSWNLYSYARNNPLSLIDPSGEYVCGSNVSAAQCDKFQESLNNAQDRANALKSQYGATDSRYTDAQRAIDAYGKENIDNGVTVNIDPNSVTSGAANTDVHPDSSSPTGYRVNVDFASDSSFSGSQNAGTLIAHEGSHVADGVDYAKSGFNPAMNPTLWASEFRAFNVQANLSAAGPYPLQMNVLSLDGKTSFNLLRNGVVPAALGPVINDYLQNGYKINHTDNAFRIFQMNTKGGHQ